MRAKLGGEAKGPKPSSGGPYVVVDGKWVAVAHDESDGVPAELALPDGKPTGEGAGHGATASV